MKIRVEGIKVDSYIGRVFRDGNLFVTKVGDQNFGKYVLDSSPWGIKLKIVIDILHDKKKKTVGYLLDDETTIHKIEALEMARKGELYNVSIVTRSATGSHLRRKKRYMNMGIC